MTKRYTPLSLDDVSDGTVTVAEWSIDQQLHHKHQWELSHAHTSFTLDDLVGMRALHGDIFEYPLSGDAAALVKAGEA